MNVVLHNLERQPDDPRMFFVAVSFGDAPPARYQASYDDSDSLGRFCNVEPDLFMELSNLAHKRFGDCTIYQMELLAIISAFASEELDLELPAQLGATKFCWSKPSRLKILRNKLSFRYTMVKWRLGIGRPELQIPAKDDNAR